MFIAYNELTGEILDLVGEGQDFETYFHYYPSDVKKNIASLLHNNPPIDFYNFKVVDGVLVRRSNLEISELLKFGRVLADDDRKLNMLRPDISEVKKAKQTIEILTLLQEVM